MKKIILIAIAVMTLPALAQDHKERKQGPHKKEAMLKDFSPEEAATLKTKQMTLHLDLTEAQQKRVKALFLEEAQFMQEKREAREAAKKDNKEKPTKEERYAMMNERLDREIAMKKNMKSILNSDQFEKWEKAQTSKHKKKIQKRQKGDEKRGR